jgi:hypothetical protein
MAGLSSHLRGAVLCGLVSGVALIGLVCATGSTFGQRCATKHEKDSAAWRVCVQTLKAGDAVLSQK